MATRQVLLQTDLLSIGRFECPPGDRRWSQENWIGPEHHVVFPSRCVVIDKGRLGRVVANPNRVVLYDAGQTYRRELVSPDGDVATWIALRPAVIRDLVDDSRTGSSISGFGRAECWVGPSELLALRTLLATLGAGGRDALRIEEEVLRLVGRLVRAGRETRAGPQPSRRGRLRAATRRGHEQLVHDAELLLSARYADPVGLGEVARTVGASPYHLARVFRAATGQSMHAYREQIRLRTALERLTRPERAGSLAALASELGFASHAHLATRFRSPFGRTPSAVRSLSASRARLRTRTRELRTIVEGTGARRR